MLYTYVFLEKSTSSSQTDIEVKTQFVNVVRFKLGELENQSYRNVTSPRFDSSPLKRDHPKKESILEKSSFFQGAILILGGVS